MKPLLRAFAPLQASLLAPVQTFLAALLLALSTTGAASAQAPSEPLGRLFFTPEQRAALDRQRHAPPPSLSPAPTANEAPASFDGMVQRSSGRNTVWINGTPVDRDAPPGSERRAHASGRQH